MFYNACESAFISAEVNPQIDAVMLSILSSIALTVATSSVDTASWQLRDNLANSRCSAQR
jgi:hypothetical protein